MQADPNKGYFSPSLPSIPPASPSGVGSSAGSSRGSQGSVSSQVGDALSGKSTPKSLEGSHALDPAELSLALNKLHSVQHDEAIAEHKKDLIEWIKANPEDVKILRDAHPEVLKDKKFIAEFREIVADAANYKNSKKNHFNQRINEHTAFVERLQSAKADIIENYNARRESIDKKHTGAVFKMMSKLSKLESGDQNLLTKYFQKAYIAVKFAIVNIQHDRAISKLEGKTFKETGKLNEKINNNLSLIDNLRKSIFVPSTESLNSIEGEDVSSTTSSSESVSSIDSSDDSTNISSYEYSPEEFDKLLANAKKILEKMKSPQVEQAFSPPKEAYIPPLGAVEIQALVEIDELSGEYADVINEAIEYGAQLDPALSREQSVHSLDDTFRLLQSIVDSNPEPRSLQERLSQTLLLSRVVEKEIANSALEKKPQAPEEEETLEKLLSKLHDSTQELHKLIEPFKDGGKVPDEEVGELIEQRARTALPRINLEQLQNAQLNFKVTGRMEALLNPIIVKGVEESGVDSSPLPSMAINYTGRLAELTKAPDEALESIYESDAPQTEFDQLLNQLKETSEDGVVEGSSSEDIDELFKDIENESLDSPRTLRRDEALAELDAILAENEDLENSPGT